MKEKEEKIKKEKMPKEKKAKKEKVKKDKETSKFVQKLKKKWLINGTKTLILVLLIIAVFIAINVWGQSLDLTPIDLTEEKLYTLTDESKEKVKDIDKDVNIYFVGYSDDDSNLSLAKQYKNANERITAEAVNAENRPDLAEKYGIETDSSGIIVECGDHSKVLTEDDLYTYDSSSYEQVSIAEEKLTSAILSVTADEIPKVYFLEGYSDFSLEQNMYYLSIYLENEIMEVNTLNILSTGNVPDDCDTLVITSPIKDFDDVATTAITDYINKGGNILWLNAAMATSVDLPNVNKILALYGVEPFEVGIIRETDTSKMISGSPDLIIPNLGYSEITEDLYSEGLIFANPTKINIDEDALAGLNVEQTNILTTSENSYFRNNFNNSSDSPAEGEETASFVVGAQLEKTVQEATSTEVTEETTEGVEPTEGTPEITSTLIIYGENSFASDYTLTQNSQYPLIELAYNKDLVLNSLAYLTDREQDITARKSTSTVTYTATEQQDTIVRAIIFTVPTLIILAGLIVWQKRRRKK